MNVSHVAELAARWAWLFEEARKARLGRSSTTCKVMTPMESETGARAVEACRWVDLGGDPDGPRRMPESEWCDGCRAAQRAHERYRQLLLKLVAAMHALRLAGLELHRHGWGTAHPLRDGAVAGVSR